MLRYRLCITLMMSLLVSCTYAQELFVYSEPASNMPAKSVAVRMTNRLMYEPTLERHYYLVPELMWGLNKRIMLHAESFFSDQQGSFAYEGSATYLKYRFLSMDKVHRHFRMAAFSRLSYINAPIQNEDITTNGQNSGYQLGLVGTQLLHKTALSATLYYEHAINTKGGYPLPAGLANKAISYSLSSGRLILPKQYTSYKQTNFNIMVEVLGQLQPENGKQYIDVAPSVQLIFNSQTRVDIGYRHELYSSMHRDLPNGVLVRVEHLFYRVI